MSKQPKPGQVWRGKHGVRAVDYFHWTGNRIVWRRPGANETHRTKMSQWLRWSATATLIDEGSEGDG